MSLNDIILNNIIYSTLLKNENNILNIIFIVGYFIINKLSEFKIYKYLKYPNKDSKIVFIASDKDSSTRYRALMQFIINKSFYL
jgi:hypothetical protein